MACLHAYYDTRYSPITFDYANFLVCADAYRQSLEFSNIHLHIVAPDFRSATPRDIALDIGEKSWRVSHILSRLPILMPSVTDITINREPPDSVFCHSFPDLYPPRSLSERIKVTPYSMKHVNSYYGLGCKVQPFQPSAYAAEQIKRRIGEDPYYTISLRTSHFQKARNSNLNEWYKAYEALIKKGHKVIVIPDFEDAMSERVSWEFKWELAEYATFELDLRMALYENAIDNLCVNNGVAAILYYSSAPLKMFKMLVDGISTTTEKHLKTHTDLSKGESPVFCNQRQKWVWELDTASNILNQINI